VNELPANPRYLTPKFSCKHTITIAAKPHPKSACQLQRLLGSDAGKLNALLSEDLVAQQQAVCTDCHIRPFC
jgi:hypothetical protein